MPPAKIYTLGCKLNQLESESYWEQFADTNEQIVIINTCTVTSKADQKARRVIRKALRNYPNATVIVTGCYAALEKERIEEILTQRTQRTQRKRLLVLNREEVLTYLNNNSRSLVSLDDRFQFFPEKFSKHTRAFLKIQDGCDNHCTYCRIRLARGKSVSLPAEQVLERLKILEQTYVETVLTGVNISQYSSAPSVPSALKLLEYLLSNTDKIAIRLSSLDPQYIDEKFAKVLTHTRIRPHFHLSIQSCSEKILQRMGRSYNAQTIEKAVTLLRSAKDDPFLACDIITGFPGETETEFAETYELCKKTGFAWIHVFPYSKRPGTPAAAYKDAVRERDVERRVKLLTELARQGRSDYVKRWMGKDVDVVILETENGAENKENREVSGLSENYLKTLVKYEWNPPAAGAVLRCKLIEQSPSNIYDTVAQII